MTLELSTHQRGLAPGVLVPEFSCANVGGRAAAYQHSGPTAHQCGSLLRGESELVSKPGPPEDILNE